MITREADYAIRIVQRLAACHASGEWVSATELAGEMDVPYRFLRNIAGILVKAGMVSSRRGRNGGVRLRSDPGRVSVADIIRLVDPDGGVMNLCMKDAGLCGRRTGCALYPKLRKIQKTLDRELTALTFDQMT
jgi:Rrf2 family protein